MKLLLLFLLICTTTKANSEATREDFLKLKDRVDYLERTIIIDRSVDQMRDYLSLRMMKLNIDLEVSIKERKEVFTVIRSCFDDIISAYPTKSFKFDYVKIIPGNNVHLKTFPSRYAGLKIGAKASLDHCRTKIITEGLYDKK